MSDVASVSYAMAFVAGLVSFLSPCVLPLAPSYVTFVTGMSLEDLASGDRDGARRQAALHAALFILGFSLVFMALGATATLFGAALRRLLPALQQAGGVVIVLFGLNLLGMLRLPVLMRERRMHLARRPGGRVGSVLVGVAFGAGWTPCVGPVLASILLYAGMQGTMGQGMLLLAVYAIGLGIPFFLAAVAFNWFLAGTRLLRNQLGVIERVAGALLVLVGALLVSGRFTILSNYLAGFGQFLTLE
ncbi:MAG TPA: cytochrome c biogenesis protein CcdA [Gemmatimonadaceae bacterium]|nr:cytochrome c biogenesis protein CcdA [Gemmatimonadaceae bacterium]